MRIGMVTACYKPVVNGVTRMVSLYRERLEAAGHEVTVFTLGEPDPAGEEPGVVRSAGIPLGETGYYFNFRYKKEAQDRLREMDVLHCHHLFMSLELAHRYSSCPIVYTNHTRNEVYAGVYTPLPQPAAQALMRLVWPAVTDLCDIIIAPSRGIRDVMMAFGVRQRIEVIPNGINLEPFLRPKGPRSRAEFGVPEESTLLIYTGRISKEKNIRTLLKQFALARDVHSNLHLLLVGSGPLEARLHKWTHELHISNAVHHPGAVPYDDVANVLAAGDAFVTASMSEVHPLTVIEAMASGLPVAGIVSPGLNETVAPGRSGFLADEEEALAATIVELVTDRTRLQTMGASAREISRHYNIDRTVSRTVALYQELLEKTLDRSHGNGLSGSERPRQRRLLEQIAELLH